MFGEHERKTKDKLERQILETLVLQTLKEQKRKRRWGIFFKFIIVILLIILIVGIFWPNHYNPKSDPNKPHIAYVSVDGIIMEGLNANANDIIDGLENAFEDKNSKAVVIQINSPGGSPVQSDEVFQAMRSLEKAYPDKPLYAVCTDVCASGGYYIASAADEIYANPMTILGSIGVRADGFGFVETLQKLGITRRLFTAGKDKDFLDPFKPLNQGQVNALDKMLAQTHQVFIDSVKEGRGKRLDLSQSETLFSGQPFSGIEGKKYGLIDGFMSMRELARQKYKLDNIVDYTYYKSPLEQLLMKVSSSLVYKAMASSSMQLRF
ncbi:S49 family peptidase [Thiotrichales bacterium 19S3-7]|nr:S49 family peptidase [Thiotrichales bacterium 19S3-7]MCF6802350.1 S49 family peptidase [Thiotrichales bacterium 19S3-11]